ncbi:hypothetical protein PMAYCL1PPCAC_31271, partial [Pristionchus mayeri]
QMRLKHLLLCTLLIVLVRSYTSDYQCQHDGYSAPDGTCHCTDLYGTSKDCRQIQCVNSGALSPYEDDNQRCSCPPGFLGLHCEPVQCVPGDVHSFEEADHARDVSIIITYNTEFQKQFKEKDKGPPIEETICNAIFNEDVVDEGSRVHFYVMEGDILTDKKDCTDDFKFAIKNCDPVVGTEPQQYNCNPRLDTDYISGVLDEMGEDSRLIIISNMGIEDFTNKEGIEQIRKKSISMRIQMHSLVISPREPKPNSVYFKDGFQTLRELSESTLGFFINPFDGSGGIKFAADGITQILNGMMDVFFEYVVVDRVITNETSCKDATDFTVFRVMQKQENDFVLTVMSSKSQYTEYTTNWIGGPGTPMPTISAGYFNAYTLNAGEKDVMSFKPFSTLKNGNCVPSTVLVLARSGHLARFAITNNLDDYDATSPYAISGEKNILVGHFKQHYHEEKLELLHLEFSSTGDSIFDITLDPAPSPRDCQYNAKFGEVECNDGDDTFIRVRDTNDGAAITVQNLYCSPKDQAAQSQSSQLLRLLKDEPPAPVCEPSPITDRETKRALIVSAHATEKIYGLFNGNKDSAIRYLNDLDDLGIYDQYILNIYNGEQQTNAQVRGSYPDFKNELMTEWHNYVASPDIPGPDQFYFDEECTADVSAVFPLEDLTSRFTDARPNSDIIFIYDKKIIISDADEMDVVKEAYSRRLRLIVLLLGCEGKDFSDSNALKKWQSLAAKTGGFAVHFGQPSDLNEFLKYYVGWVQGQTASASDNVDINVAFWMQPATSTPFKVKENGNYTILVNSVPSVSEVTLSNGFKLVNPTALGNSIAQFDFHADKDDTLTVTATPSIYFFYVSIRVLDLNDDYATIGFSKTKDAPCLTKEYPDYSPHDPQYPVTVASADDSVEMTLFDSTVSSLRTGSATGSDGTFALDYNWRCSDNQNLFYISSDVTTADGSYTRVFTTQCIGEADGAACINGEQKPGNKDVCVCPHDYTGDLCEIPVCQNGGSVTVSLECDCPGDYGGFFCENYNGCTTDPKFTPDFKSIANTVIFVVERSTYVTDQLELITDDPFTEIRAAQYIIVQYGNETEIDVTVSTTDKAALLPVLKGITPIDLSKIDPDLTSDQYFDAIPAITAALKTQVTGSAQIFWFAEFDQADNLVGSLFDPIAKQRVSISALFSESVLVPPAAPDDASTTPSTDGPVIHPVQMTGGSVFYAANAIYDKFFTEYIAVLLQFQTKFERRPNLLASSLECNAAYTVNIDQSTEKLFVAANGGVTIDISIEPQNMQDPIDIPGGKVFTFRGSKNVYKGAGEVTVTISGQNDDYCSSTVTAFNQIQVAYEFVKDDSDTTTMIKTGKGKHLLVTYWTAEYLKDAPTPTATVTSISSTEGFFNSIVLYTTVRSNCSYSLSVPIDCSDGVNAIGVKFTNWILPAGGLIESKVDKYIPVLCPEGTCEHGTTTDYGCDCESFWGGDYCTELLCQNGVFTGDACECFTGYTGDNCVDKIDPADRDDIAFLFIQDVCGYDDTLKDEAQSVYKNYMDLLNKGESVYLGTNDPSNSESVLVKTSQELLDAMTANRGQAAQCTSSIGPTLDSYYLKLRQPSSASSIWLNAASDPSVGTARIAHVTTVGIDAKTGSYFDKLNSDYILNMQFIGITYKNEYFTDLDSFKVFKGATITQTYDPNVALVDLVNAYGSDVKFTTPSPDIKNRCIQNLQAAFAFHTDISSVTNMTEYRKKAQDVIKSVTKYFSVPGGNIDLDD